MENPTLRESEIKTMLLIDHGKRRQRSRALPHRIIKGIAVSRHIVPVITGDLNLPNTALTKNFLRRSPDAREDIQSSLHSLFIPSHYITNERILVCCADILVNQCRLRIPERRETSFKLTLAGLIWKLYLPKEF